MTKINHKEYAYRFPYLVLDLFTLLDVLKLEGDFPLPFWNPQYGTLLLKLFLHTYCNHAIQLVNVTP